MFLLRVKDRVANSKLNAPVSTPSETFHLLRGDQLRMVEVKSLLAADKRGKRHGVRRMRSLRPTRSTSV